METLFENGTVLTMEDGELYAEALLARDGRIAAVGDRAAVTAQAGPGAERVDLAGRTLLPAFIDAHSHFSAVANGLLQVSLEGCASAEEIGERIRDHIRQEHVPAGQWVTAQGYDHNALAEKRHPPLAVLDAAAPENPVMVQHQSGHMGVFNTRALERLGITPDTPAPAGGAIGREDGRLTGYLEENAFLHYQRQVPLPSLDALLGAYRKAQALYASYGITTVQEGLLAAELVPLYRVLLQSGLLELDLVGYADASGAAMEAFPDHVGRTYRDHFRIGGYKMFLDGSPQGRTAWMRTPYSGTVDDCGYGTMTDRAVGELVRRSAREGVQLLAHCNGDAACAQYLRAVAAAEGEGLDVAALRPVIIHAQLLGLDQLPEVRRLGLLPSFFVAHVYHWGDVHIRNFGPGRAAEISPARSAEDLGIPFTFHQDAPVIRPDMLETVWCAVERRTRDGVLLGPDQRVAPLTALRAVTANAACQYFEEGEKGTLAPGKRADLAVLDRDPLQTPGPALRDIRVLETWKDGRRIYQRA